MSNLGSLTKRALVRIREQAPSEDAVRREYERYNNRYRESVTQGDGSRESGMLILDYLSERDAYFIYAAERGISLTVGGRDER